MIINVTFDQADSALPAGFKSVVNAAVAYLENLFTDPITLKIGVGFGEVNGNALTGTTIGSSSFSVYNFSYSQIVSALSADAKTSDDHAAVATIPATNPTGTGAFRVSQAEAKALGLIGSTSSYDGYVGFSSTTSFDYDNSNGVSAGSFDFFGVVLHEITEVMGRVFGDGTYFPLELFHYSSPGVRDFSGTQPGYFSIDNGTTNLASFNTDPSGDFADWASSVGNDAFRAFAPSGRLLTISEADLKAMDVIGYDRTSVSAGPAKAFDFNGDGKGDFLWQNDNGQAGIWLLNGTSILSAPNVGPNPGSSWHIKGSGDFDGSGQADILWQNDSGQAGIWLMNGTTVLSSPIVGPNPGPAWHIMGAGDFNGDSKSDILWQNDDGQAAIWLMNGTSLVTGTPVGPNPGPAWHVKGSGDFNGDGKADILWQNDNGQAAIWLMNGTTLISGTTVGPNPGTAWHVKGAGDFDGDGKSDILWQNDNGQAGIWLMNGLTPLNLATVGPNPGPSWQVKGAGDINGDGKADILWQSTGGQPGAWLMNGVTPVNLATVGPNPGTAWHLVTQSA